MRKLGIGRIRRFQAERRDQFPVAQRSLEHAKEKVLSGDLLLFRADDGFAGSWLTGHSAERSPVLVGYGSARLLREAYRMDFLTQHNDLQRPHPGATGCHYPVWAELGPQRQMPRCPLSPFVTPTPEIPLTAPTWSLTWRCPLLAVHSRRRQNGNCFRQCAA